MEGTKYIKAYYTDEEDLLKGVKLLKENNIEIFDVLVPFPVHGLNKLLGYRRSWIARAGFAGGAIGAVSGFLLQTWVFTDDYPMNIGGKPFFSVLSFIPVTFELTILFAAFAMVFAFLIRSRLGPGSNPVIHDEKITDDRFVVLTGPGGDTSENNLSRIRSVLESSGALEITFKSDMELKRNY